MVQKHQLQMKFIAIVGKFQTWQVIKQFEDLFADIEFGSRSHLTKQEGQEAPNRSPEFCLKLTYKYLLKAGHVPGDTWGGANFGPRGII